MINADWFLNQAVKEMADRAASRDTGAERSMERAVNAFNAMFGKDLTAVQGWQFMELLKMARSVGGEFRADDFTDGAAYAALAGEQASQKGDLTADDKADAMKYDIRNACPPFFVNGTVEKSPFLPVKVPHDAQAMTEDNKAEFIRDCPEGRYFCIRLKNKPQTPWRLVKLVEKSFKGWHGWITIHVDGDSFDLGIDANAYDFA